MKRIIILVSCLAALLLCSCGSTNPKVTPETILAHRQDYLSAQNGCNLVIPPPLSDYLISREFDVPTIHGQVGIEPTPPGSIVSKKTVESTKV